MVHAPLDEGAVAVALGAPLELTRGQGLLEAPLEKTAFEEF